MKNETFIKVTWNPVPRSKANGIILGYRILLQKDSETMPVVNSTVDDSSNYIEVADLQPNSVYEFNVFGFTRRGGGKRATVKFVTTEGGLCWCSVAFY